MSTCEACGQAIPEPEVVVEEAVDLEPVAEAEVRIAEIEANRDVTIAKIESRVVDEEIIAQIAALQAEVEVLRAASQPQEQEQQEAVVVVAPEPEIPSEPAPEPRDESSVPEPTGKAKSRKNPWWS